MIRISDTLEYRFVVPGRAASFRSASSVAYKRRVRRHVPVRLKHRPLRASCDVRLDYFHSSPRRFDMDNVAKCVLDAMNEVAYIDDKLVRLQSATAHDLTRRFVLHGGPVDLVKPLRRYLDYLFVRIRIAT